MKGIVALVLVCACGRLGFDPLATDDGGPEGGGDGPAFAPDSEAPDGPDAPPGAIRYEIEAVSDTALNSFAPNLNYGAAPAFNVRTSALSTFVGLVQFDLSGLPAGTVVSADLELTTTTAAFADNQACVYEVFERWDEGTENGAVGVASHIERLPGIPWISPGCGVGSRASTELAAFSPTQTNTAYRLALAPDRIQGWLDSPDTNRGLAVVADLAGTSETVGFSSREGAAPPRPIVTLSP